MKLLWMVGLAGLIGSAQAQDLDEFPEEVGAATAAATIFVAPFVAKDRSAVGIAGMMPSFLEMELDQHPELKVIYLDEIPPVHDQDAAAYLDGCPPGQIVGCAFVVAENSGARFALAGTARSIPAGIRAEIVIIDVVASREVIAFQIDLGTGDDERFAEGVAGVLVAVVKGEAGRVEDIRDLSEEEAPDYTAAVSQLGALSGEIGDVNSLQVRPPTKIRPPGMTSEQIADRMETEGVKPWERVGMGPNEYLRYKNSGMALSEWQVRNRGRKGELIIRPAVGYARGPTHGKYYGSYARGGVETLEVQEVYAWQSQLSGGGLHTSASLGYGMSRMFEVGGTVGYAQGRYEIEVLSKTINNTAAPTHPTEHPNPNLFFGGYFLAVMMPDSAIRPVAGGGMTYWRGSGVETKEQLPDDLPKFGAPVLILAEARVGAEARLSSKVDAFIHVPITAVVGGSDTATRHQGADCAQDDGTNCLRTSMTPPGISAMGAGVMLGLQFRLFGKKFDKVRYREFDVDDGDLD
jgi:hypothetical protein